jgi:hydroxyquinol 1,2-dioxygenase
VHRGAAVTLTGRTMTATKRSIIQTHTQTVLASLQNAPDARLREILLSLVRLLHDFVEEVGLTEAEWAQGIHFLTRAGQICTDKRQELILLSDTLGVSMLVDAINHPSSGGCTENTVFGPFHVEGSPERPFGADIRGGLAGELTHVLGRVLSTGGRPLADATIEVWQVRPDMLYDVQDPETPGMQLRATFRTGIDGAYSFWTLKPVSYPIPCDGPAGELLKASGRHPWRPAHIHFRIRAPGHRAVVTHLFVAGDEYLRSDAVFGVKDSLVVEFRERQAAAKNAPADVTTGHLEVEYDFVLTPE